MDKTITDADRIRLLARRLDSVAETVVALRGRNAALEARIKELHDLRDLDRAKVAVLASQVLEVTTCQIELATGGLQNRVPEPSEALSALTIHAGRKVASTLGQKIAAAIALLALGGLASLPLFNELVQGPRAAEIKTLNSDG
jgi:hypothetical protein